MAEPRGSDSWWLKHLGKALEARNRRIRRFDAYYGGQHNLGFMSDKFRKAFGGIFDGFADNWCQLVVDAVAERLGVVGFRWGEQQGDAQAWEIWQANQLDSLAGLAHVDALVCEETYALVWPGEKHPRITVEHPSQTIIARDPARPQQRSAALKVYRDDDRYQVAYLYLPDVVRRFRSEKQVDDTPGHVLSLENARWTPDMREGIEDPAEQPNPLGVVPVVPLTNQPRVMRPWGRSEIANVIPLQDYVNMVFVQMATAGEFTAFPQRYLLGWDVEVDDDGNTLPLPFKPGVDRIWQLEDPEGDPQRRPAFGEFRQADMGPFIAMIEMVVQHIAAQTRTPPHYLLGQSGAFPSGEALKATETGLVAKVRQRQVHFGEAWEETMRLALVAAGETEKAQFTAAETMWADPESRTEGEHVDATLKKQTLGVPWQQLMEDIGYTPQQIVRMRQMRFEDDLDTLIGQGAEAPSPAETEPDLLKRANAAGILIRSGFDPDESLAAVGIDPIRHLGLLPVTVKDE